MNVIVYYNSKTGITKQAAETMAKAFKQKGHVCTVEAMQQADPKNASRADLICLGTWTAGLFIIFQNPEKYYATFVQKLPKLQNKKVVLFCTYKLAIGKTLAKMETALLKHDAQVVGRFKFRGPQPTAEFETFVAALK